MATLSASIETMEHRWMRAWISRDQRAMKSLTSGNFRMIIAAKPPVLLDAPSWLEAAVSRYQCASYRFGEVYVRGHGSMAVFATRVDLEVTMDGIDWSGEYWITDLWRKGRIRRSWRMIERILSRPEERLEVTKAIRSLQLWR
jgi:hypothetical protein